MSKDFEQNSETDDLIAELARMMAQDAKKGSEVNISSPQSAANDGSANIEQNPSKDKDEGQQGITNFQLPEELKDPAQMRENLDKVLSASERLSATRSAKKFSQEQGGEHSQIEENLPNMEYGELSTNVSSEIREEVPLAEEGQNNLENSQLADDPIARLIAQQLEEEELSENENRRVGESGDVSVSENSQFAQIQNNNAQPDSNLQNDNVQPQNENSGDRFESAPIFGLGGNGNVSPTAPQANYATKGNDYPEDMDPLEEIESLIGEAVRDSARAKQDRLSDIGENMSEETISVDEAAKAAESKILAAAIDSQNIKQNNDRVAENINIVPEQQPELQNMQNEQKSSFLRKFLGPVVAGLFFWIVGFALYYYFVVVPKNDSTNVVPVLSAETEPEKIIPSTQSDEEEQSVVMNELGGEKNTPQNEQLISRDESQNNDPIARVIETSDNGNTQTTLTNRKVKTVTVRPDGTIISGDTARAGNEALPIERPNVPNLPANSTNEAALQANQPVISNQNQPSQTQVQIATGPAGASSSDPQTSSSSGANIQTSTSPSASNSGAVDLLANSANEAVTQIQTGPATNDSATSVASQNGANNLTIAPAYVQVASRREEQNAQKSLIEIKTRFASIIGDRIMEIQRADLGDKGIYYRVRIPADSIENANQICNSLKLAGGDCFVRTD